MIKGLDKGKWTRPTDKSAVYLEFAPGAKWGVRVTLMEYDARVEAVNGPKGTWYKGPERYSTLVRRHFLERILVLHWKARFSRQLRKNAALPKRKTGVPDCLILREFLQVTRITLGGSYFEAANCRRHGRPQLYDHFRRNASRKELTLFYPWAICLPGICHILCPSSMPSITSGATTMTVTILTHLTVEITSTAR